MKDLKQILASWGRVFIVAALIKFMDLGSDIFALNMDNLKHLVQAGMAAMIPVIIRYANPNDSAFGVTKKQEHEKVN